MSRYSKEELFILRNCIPVRDVVTELLQIPNKVVEGVFRFLCPECNEFETGIHEENNLSRCFRCQKNFNTIEIVMSDRKVSFIDSVKLLQKYKNINIPKKSSLDEKSLHSEAIERLIFE